MLSLCGRLFINGVFCCYSGCDRLAWYEYQPEGLTTKNPLCGKHAGIQKISQPPLPPLEKEEPTPPTWIVLQKTAKKRKKKKSDKRRREEEEADYVDRLRRIVPPDFGKGPPRRSSRLVETEKLKNVPE